MEASAAFLLSVKSSVFSYLQGTEEELTFRWVQGIFRCVAVSTYHYPQFELRVKRKLNFRED